MKTKNEVYQKIVEALKKDYDEGFRTNELTPFLNDKISDIVNKIGYGRKVYYSLTKLSPSYEVLKPLLEEIYQDDNIISDGIYEETEDRSEYHITTFKYEDFIYIRFIEAQLNETLLIEKY